MKKPKVIFLVLVAVVAITIAYLLLDSFFAANTPQSPRIKFPVSNSGDKISASEGNVVYISNFRFIPETVNIKAGETVTWANNDGAVHSVKAETFSSVNIKNNETYQHKFEEIGTYNYTCSNHPYMRGVVVVQ